MADRPWASSFRRVDLRSTSVVTVFPFQQPVASCDFHSSSSAFRKSPSSGDFTRIVYLRNMQDTGDMVFTHDRFAAEILRSWSGKDEPAMRSFLDKLPEGPERSTFIRAAGKLEE